MGGLNNNYIHVFSILNSIFWDLKIPEILLFAMF